jgi:hypothetical protein
MLFVNLQTGARRRIVQIRKMKTHRYILSSTHIDSHRHKMAKSALDGAATQLNGPRKMRLGLEHIRTFPPFGVVTNGQVFQGVDKEYYLAGDNIFFDKQEILVLEDGTELLKESFSTGGYPFIECEETESTGLKIFTDPVNYEKPGDIFDIFEAAKEESGLPFDHGFLGRKSNLPPPETIITITQTLAIALGLVATKIPQKLGEAIGEDLAKFYKLISRIAVDTIKKAIPANRPINFVIAYPNPDSIVELVITTRKLDDVLNALTPGKLKLIQTKLDQLKNLNPEKIQFFYNTSLAWEFNYLLTRQGDVIGTIASFNRRNLLYNQILQAQEAQADNRTS